MCLVGEALRLLAFVTVLTAAVAAAATAFPTVLAQETEKSHGKGQHHEGEQDETLYIHNTDAIK